MLVTLACFCICDFSRLACSAVLCLMKSSCTFQLESHCWGSTLTSWLKQLLLLPRVASLTHPCRSAYPSLLSVPPASSPHLMGCPCLVHLHFLSIQHHICLARSWCSDGGVLCLALFNFWVNNSWRAGAALCIAGYVAASLASTH